MDENLQIKKVGEIRDVGFDIPAYQRGYRWGKEQVQQLLDDFLLAIKENQQKSEKKQVSYYLQPVVLRNSGEKIYELIDGQQRLTTLWLLCKSIAAIDPRMGKTMPNFSLTYSTKGESTEFLRKLTQGEELQPQTIDQENFLTAYQIINTFLNKLYDDEDTDKFGKFRSFVINKVKIIWYEVTGTAENGKELFMKINRGRIPLTNAELIKAYLLAHVSDGVSIPEEQEQRQIEITSCWDDMEQSFHDPAFWAFISAMSEEEWQDKPRMEYFFDLITPPEDCSHEDEYRVFYHYAEVIKDQQYRGNYILRDIWRSQIRSGYLKLKEWYEDRALYHKIGYLIAVTENPIDRKKFLNKLLNLKIAKHQFHFELDKMIRESLGVTDGKSIVLDSLQYNKPEDYRKLKKLLLLFNVLCCITPASSAKAEDADDQSNFIERYSFEKHHKYQWSLEHVNPQSEGLLIEGKNKIDIQDMVNWLKKHLPWVKMANEELYKKAAEAVNCNGANLDGNSFAVLRQDIVTYFNNDFPDVYRNSIKNLALLAHSQNSSLGNDIFAEKRKNILLMISQGEFVPLCTRRLFLKFFSAGTDSIDIDEITADSILKYNYIFWTLKDADDYYRALEKTLSTYLK